MATNDGSGSEERLTTSNDNEVATGASPDGQALVSTIDRDLWILPLTGDKKPRPFVQTPFSDHAGTFSPHSQWLAYQSDDSGRNEIYIQPFPGGGERAQISKDGGMEPRWTSSGELFYRNGNKMMAVKMNTKPTLTVGVPQIVFEGSQYIPANVNTFDVNADGKRFLMIKEPDQAASNTQVNVVLKLVG